MNIMRLMNIDRPRGLRAGLLGIAAIFAGGCSDAPLGPLELTPIPSPAGEFSGQAHLATTQNGGAVLSWLEPTTGDGMVLKLTSLAPGSDAWTAPRSLAEGEDWFINWADFPSVVPIDGDVWAAHWLVFREDYEGYDIDVAISTDAGESWGEPFLLNTDGKAAEHGFVTLFPLDGDIGAVWLDGRNMIVDGEFVESDAAGNPVGTSLRYARFDTAGERLSESAIDEYVCDCCQPDIALADTGPIVVYRDRSTEEIRDIVTRRMADGEWDAVVALPPDHWYITGCPVNGPAVAAEGDTVVVAWFSAADDQPIVHFARSTDAGASFGDAIDIDTAGSFGYVDVELLANGDGVVSWLQKSGDDLAFVTRRVTAAGELQPIEPIAAVDLSRPLDFPQMISVGDRLVFAWIDYTTGSNVVTATGRYGP